MSDRREPSVRAPSIIYFNKAGFHRPCSLTDRQQRCPNAIRISSRWLGSKPPNNTQYRPKQNREPNLQSNCICIHFSNIVLAEGNELPHPLASRPTIQFAGGTKDERKQRYQ